MENTQNAKTKIDKASHSYVHYVQVQHILVGRTIVCPHLGTIQGFLYTNSWRSGGTIWHNNVGPSQRNPNYPILKG